MLECSPLPRACDRIQSHAVRQRVEELFLNDSEAQLAILDDELLMQMLSELRAPEALQVLQIYVDTVESHLRSGGVLEAHQAAAYLMRLAHAAKGQGASAHSPQPYRVAENGGGGGGGAARNGYGAPAAQQADRAGVAKALDRLSPGVQQMVEDVFCTDEDRAVMEDRALMLLLSKIPEAQTRMALRKYQQTIQQRGRSSINNPCGYLISLLKKAQQDVREEDTSPVQPGLSKSARPLRTLKPRVRAELEKTFESKRDRSVLEDVGLIKQLGRLDEAQALEAIANYREAASRRGGKSILNPSAYFMVILREFIEGTTPLHSGGGSGGAMGTPHLANGMNGLSLGGGGGGVDANGYARRAPAHHRHPHLVPPPALHHLPQQQQQPPALAAMAAAAQQQGGYVADMAGGGAQPQQQQQQRQHHLQPLPLPAALALHNGGGGGGSAAAQQQQQAAAAAAGGLAVRAPSPYSPPYMDASLSGPLSAPARAYCGPGGGGGSGGSGAYRGGAPYYTAGAGGVSSGGTRSPSPPSARGYGSGASSAGLGDEYLNGGGGGGGSRPPYHPSIYAPSQAAPTIQMAPSTPPAFTMTSQSLHSPGFDAGLGGTGEETGGHGAAMPPPQQQQQRSEEMMRHMQQQQHARAAAARHQQQLHAQVAAAQLHHQHMQQQFQMQQQQHAAAAQRQQAGLRHAQQQQQQQSHWDMLQVQAQAQLEEEEAHAAAVTAASNGARSNGNGVPTPAAPSLSYFNSQEDVSTLLTRLGLHKYAGKLQAAEVDMQASAAARGGRDDAALLLFEEMDLKELGIPKGPRIKLLHTLHGDCGAGGSSSGGGVGSSTTASPMSAAGEGGPCGREEFGGSGNGGDLFSLTAAAAGGRGWATSGGAAGQMRSA